MSVLTVTCAPSTLTTLSRQMANPSKAYKPGKREQLCADLGKRSPGHTDRQSGCTCVWILRHFTLGHGHACLGLGEERLKTPAKCFPLTLLYKILNIIIKFLMLQPCSEHCGVRMSSAHSCQVRVMGTI